MKRIILLAFIACSSFTYSQQYSNPLPEMGWQLHEVPTNVSFAYNPSSAKSFEKGIVYVSESEAVAPVHYPKGYGLVKINKNGEVVWNTPMPGYILGVSKFKGSILVLYTPDWNEERDGWAVIEKASMALIDAGTGKKLKEAVIFDAKSTFTEITTVKKPSDEFSCILVRTTPYNGKKSIKKDELIATTLKLSALELGDDLKVVGETAIKVADNAAFVGSVANENGELFITTIEDKTIRIEKFNPSFVSQKKLESSINYNKKFPPRNLVLAFDDHNSQSVVLATSFKGVDDKVMANQFWNFQFGTGKVSTNGAELLTHDFARGISQVNSDKTKSRDLKDFDAMIPVGVVTLKDKIIVIKEVKWTYSLFENRPSSPTRYVNGDLLVSFYDKEGKLLKHLGFDKKYESFLTLDRSIGYKLMNNKLYIVANGMPGGLRFRTMLCAINTDQMTMEGLGQLEEVRIRGELPVAGNGTFWFNKTLLLNHLPTLKRSALRKVEL